MAPRRSTCPSTSSRFPARGRSRSSAAARPSVVASASCTLRPATVTVSGERAPEPRSRCPTKTAIAARTTSTTPATTTLRTRITCLDVFVAGARTLPRPARACHWELRGWEVERSSRKPAMPLRMLHDTDISDVPLPLGRGQLADKYLRGRIDTSLGRMRLDSTPTREVPPRFRSNVLRGRTRSPVVARRQLRAAASKRPRHRLLAGWRPPRCHRGPRRST